MNIAHIVSTYPPYYGGMGNVVLQTVSHLIERGHTVEVMTPLYDVPKAKKDFQEKQNYARQLEPSFQYGKAAYIPEVKKMLDDFDIVHLHYPFFGTANVVKKWKQRNPEKKLVITYHMDTRAPSWKGLIFKWYAKFWMPKILRSADLLIASSFDYIESSDAVRIFAEQTEKTVQLPFGVDVDRFAPREKSKELFEKYNLDINKPVLVFVGGMDAAHYFKGIPVLLKALHLLKNEGKEFQTVLVGDGELRQQFEAQASMFGLSSFVKFAGRVSDKELPEYYNMGDLCVLPSIHRGEAFGMVLLEAMASGVPVLASDLPGVRTVAMDAGVVVSPNSPVQLAQRIDEFFKEENNREEWKIRARNVAVEKYSWDHITAQLEALYAGLLEKKI